jgi:16S rRNA (cytidine1402-2'-O)-methyltransferase
MLFLIPTILAPDTSDRVLSPQIKEVIQKTDYYFVENVRTARRFISELKLGKVIEQLTFFELNKDTPIEQVRQYFSEVPRGTDIGVISEAGCPGVADPGSLAVKVAHQYNIKVVPLVGPSSILLALMASGFSGQSFVFHGYLPIDKQERIKKIKALENESRKQQTQIFMETPFRNNSFLEDILQNCHSQTNLCIAANVTASDELIQTKTIAEWAKKKPDLHKIPTMFLMG